MHDSKFLYDSLNEKKAKFIIKDWADNVKFNGKEFDTFEDAWGHIYEYAEGCEDDDFSDFHVEEVEE